MTYTLIKTEKLKQALDCIKMGQNYVAGGSNRDWIQESIDELHTALAEPCEFVGWEVFAMQVANGQRLQYDKPVNLPSYLGVRPLYAPKEPT